METSKTGNQREERLGKIKHQNGGGNKKRYDKKGK
jgi:hypothetical protein